MPARTITVLYFAAARTATNLFSEKVELPGDAAFERGFPLAELGALLVQRHAGSSLGKVLESSQWSVDEEMVESVDEVLLKGGEEVAVIPPVSGG